MTTIAATRVMMAADSRVTIGDTSYLATKLMLFPDAIVGVAGDNECCHLFFEWWPHRQTKNLKLPKGIDIDALVLTRSGLYIYHNVGIPDMIKDGIGAVGTGTPIALASMDTMMHLGKVPDPRVAIEVACKRNPDSSLPVDYYTIEDLDGASSTISDENERHSVQPVRKIVSRSTKLNHDAGKKKLHL